MDRDDGEWLKDKAKAPLLQQGSFHTVFCVVWWKPTKGSPVVLDLVKTILTDGLVLVGDDVVR